MVVTSFLCIRRKNCVKIFVKFDFGLSSLHFCRVVRNDKTILGLKIRLMHCARNLGRFCLQSFFPTSNAFVFYNGKNASSFLLRPSMPRDLGHLCSSVFSWKPWIRGFTEDRTETDALCDSIFRKSNFISFKSILIQILFALLFGILISRIDVLFICW